MLGARPGAGNVNINNTDTVLVFIKLIFHWRKQTLNEYLYKYVLSLSVINAEKIMHVFVPQRI